MRIIQLIGNHGRSGAGRVAYHLGEGLRQAGHQVIYAANPKFLTEFFGGAEETESCWPIHSFDRWSFGELIRFNRRAATADIVLTQDSKSRHVAIAAKCLGLRPRLWFVRHCASGTSRLGAGQLNRLLVDQQVAVSDFVLGTILKSGFSSERANRIYAAVDLKPFLRPDLANVARLRAELLNDMPAGAMVIGIVARMAVTKKWRLSAANQKGYDVLFKALARVRFPYRLLIMGPSTPEAQAALSQMARFHGANPDHFRFTGFARDIADHFPLMDINVLPARNEGLGLGLVEGMASGVASVGARDGGIPEIIRHDENGLLCEAGNAEHLAVCLERLAHDAEFRARLAYRGRETVLSRFNPSRMVQSFCDLLARKSFAGRQQSLLLPKAAARACAPRQ